MYPVPIKILLIEDDPGDAVLTMDELKDDKLLLDITHQYDAATALDEIRDPEKDACKIDLIILDLNLPGMNGHEFLKRIKELKHLMSIPVVILSTSEEDEDIVKSYEDGAACYVKKPINLEKFKYIIKEIKNFWFTVAKIPQNGGS